MSDEAVALTPTVALPLSARVRVAVRDPAAWLQLLRFAAVGASGYVVNLVVFALALHGAGADYRVAAVAAFGVAVSNNFLWNSRWTFRAEAGRVDSTRHQAARFLVVSVSAFVAGLGLLTVLVEVAGVAELPAQAVAIVAVTPFSFLANKLWSFRR